jgi:hypothetical protein
MEDSMPIPDRKILIQHMDETRAKIEGLLPQIDPHKEIYPWWTIREVLAHVAGWDDATIDALRAHLEGRPLTQSEIHDFDEYNAQSISSRTALKNDQVLKEWRSTREALRTMIEEFPEDSFNTPVTVPWGGKSTLMDLMEMFCDHEDSHTRDVQKWLQHPDKPLLEEGE